MFLVCNQTQFADFVKKGKNFLTVEIGCFKPVEKLVESVDNSLKFS